MPARAPLFGSNTSPTERLWQAARRALPEEVDAALRDGADPHARDSDGHDAISLLTQPHRSAREVEGGLLDCARLLIPRSRLRDRHSRPGCSGLLAQAAAFEEHEAIPLLEALLAAGADDPSRGRADTALMVAAWLNRPGSVQLLLPLSDPLAQDERGMTALLRSALDLWGSINPAFPPAAPRATFLLLLESSSSAVLDAVDDAGLDVLAYARRLHGPRSALMADAIAARRSELEAGQLRRDLPAGSAPNAPARSL